MQLFLESRARAQQILRRVGRATLVPSHLMAQLGCRVGGTTEGWGREKDHAVYPLLGNPVENMRDGAAPLVS